MPTKSRKSSPSRTTRTRKPADNGATSPSKARGQRKSTAAPSKPVEPKAVKSPAKPKSAKSTVAPPRAAATASAQSENADTALKMALTAFLLAGAQLVEVIKEGLEEEE